MGVLSGKEKKQKTESRDETQKIDVAEYKEETPKRHVIQVEII